jgi:hypothetical protein
MKDLSHGKDVSFQSMCDKVGGQSMQSEYHPDEGQNEYERNHKSFYGENGFDWSGMEKGKK